MQEITFKIRPIEKTIPATTQLGGWVYRWGFAGDKNPIDKVQSGDIELKVSLDVGNYWVETWREAENGDVLGDKSYRDFPVGNEDIVVMVSGSVDVSFGV